MVGILVFGAWAADIYFLTVLEGESSRSRFLITASHGGLSLKKNTLSLCPHMAPSRIDTERKERGRLSGWEGGRERHSEQVAELSLPVFIRTLILLLCGHSPLISSLSDAHTSFL